MNKVYANSSSTLGLGRQGENFATQVIFDLSGWVAGYGDGAPELIHQRVVDEKPYPVPVERVGDTLIWTVSNLDTEVVSANGRNGRCELRYYVGETLVKSRTWLTCVSKAMGTPSETRPPESDKGWVDKVLEASASAQEAAKKAEEALSKAPVIGDNGNWFVWDNAAGKYVDTGRYSGGGGTGGGTTDHSKLKNRDAAGQHPMSAITGLEKALEGKQPTGSYLTDKDLDATLKESGKAADAKATGDALRSLSEEIVSTAESKVSAHNTGTDTHSDIRLLISGLTDRINALADSDDTTLDQLSEVVSYIKSNRTLIEAITTSKVSVADIVDNLTTNVANKPLSAAQGVVLKALIDAITVPDKLPNPNALTFTGAVEGSYDGSKPLTVDIPSGGGGGCSNIIFDSGEISEEVNMIGPIDISGYSKIRIFGKAYPSANSAGKRAAQLYFGDNSHRLLCRTGVNKLFDTRGNPVAFLIYLDVGANAISTFSFSGFNAGNVFNDSDYCVSSEVSTADGGCLIYSTSFDLANMYITAQDDLSTRPWGVGTRIMVIGDA